MRFFTPVESSSLLLSKEVHQIWQIPWPWLRFNLFHSKLWITKSQNNMKQFNLTWSTSIQSHLFYAILLNLLALFLYCSNIFSPPLYHLTRLSAPSLLPLYLYGLVPCYNSSKHKKRIAYQHNTPPNTTKNQCHFLTLSSSSSSPLPFCFSLFTQMIRLKDF